MRVNKRKGIDSINKMEFAVEQICKNKFKKSRDYSQRTKDSIKISTNKKKKTGSLSAHQQKPNRYA